MRRVFQPKLDILGMVIYATEFVLWCGVFACGAWFNLRPWIKQNEKSKHEVRRETGSGNEGTGEGRGGNEVVLERVGSSTSVFRTPSSVASLRTSVRVETVG